MMSKTRGKTLYTVVLCLLFLLYLVWWVWMFIAVKEGSPYRDYFVDTYGIIAGIGGFLGFYTSRKWGYFKSYVGKALIFFSLGLISQFLGQVSYSILFYVYGIENAYPSFGEIFYFGSIPLYIMGLWYIGKASGLSFTLKSFKNRLISILFPVLMVCISYLMFLKNYDLSNMPFINIMLDFSYPIGEALYVSLAITTFYMTNTILGGVMRKKVLFVLFSLVFQYIADTFFIYETRSGIWIPGGVSDLMFIISYFLMGVGLLLFTDIDNILRKFME